jgi:hypothetical protein
MKALLKARGRSFVVLCATISCLALPPLGEVLADAPRAEDSLNIVVDEARLIRMPERAATVIVGNPLIADVSLQPGGLMVLTGKGYGRTNLIALDRGGNKLLEKNLLVKAPGDTVVVYRGVLRETYSCAPTCEPRITLGDAPPFFDATLNQTVTRNTQASAIR